jgi:dihydrolipoamide dehydrogenase
MVASREVRVPSLGDFTDVPVIEVLVSVAPRVQEGESLVVLESDKATMDVPAPMSGVVRCIDVTVGARVSEGTLLLSLETNDDAVVSKPSVIDAASVRDVASAAGPRPQMTSESVHPSPDVQYQLVVIGGGPGGYTAAFRAADLGLKVALIDRNPTLGGVCLNVGCIPSKALLHAAKVVEDAHSMEHAGISFATPRIDIGRLAAWKNSVVARLTGGLSQLAKRRKVDVLTGEAAFVSSRRLRVVGAGGSQVVGFEQCILAVGSEPVRLASLPDDPRIIDSTGALELAGIPRRLLVVGGGIIGLEMACVYSALGTEVTVVELSAGLMPGCDPDLVRPLEKRLRARYRAIHVGVAVAGATVSPSGVTVTFTGAQAPQPTEFDKVLVAIGRRPNGDSVHAESAGVQVDARGFIAVDRQLRTNVPHVFAIGDIVGQPMLAHKASHQGKVAAEVAAGLKRGFDARVIPSVAYTDPEIAWVGLTEVEAAARGISVGKGVFPWLASGRSLALNREEGFTKLLFDPVSHRLLGAGIVGTSAGDLIAELALAIEMGADASDIALTIHPHPTLSETVGLAAESFEGTLTDLYIPKK